MNKRIILKVAFNILMKSGSVSIKDISDAIKIDIHKLNDLFAYGDNELLMDTVEYAGKLWVDKIKIDVLNAESVDAKLRILASGYALGSKDFPQSLSVYIDLWKIIKDSDDKYIRDRLKNIYNLYINEFDNIIKSIADFNICNSDLRAYSLFMTIISDVLHIQSITLQNDVDFDGFEKIIKDITVQFFMRYKE